MVEAAVVVGVAVVVVVVVGAVVAVAVVVVVVVGVIMIDCLVIAPGNNRAVYQELAEEVSGIEPPIWAGMLTKALQKRGKEALCVDATLVSDAKLIKFIDDSKPRLIAVVVYGQQPSASTQNMYAAKKLCKTLKQARIEAPILMIGGHVSALPEETKEHVKCDYVAKGEGLITILNILDGTNHKEEMAKDLVETYPGIPWEQLPMEKYRAHNWHAWGYEDRHRYASIYTSLGCPFKCSFCCINAPFDSNSFRYWDPDFTANEIEKLHTKYAVKHLKIADEMFVLNENHFMRLCENLIELKLDLNIWAYARVDTVKDKYLETLKKAGVNWLALGIESGSKYVRDGVIKGRFDMDDIRNVCSTIRSHGINIIGNFIFGLPDDTEASMKETYDLSVDLNCEFANFYCAMAYPGSKLYTETRKEDLPDSYIGYSQHSFETKPLPTKTVAARRVLELRDSYFHKYFERPEYLNMVESKFGAKTKAEVQKMTSIKLKRKLLEP